MERPILFNTEMVQAIMDGRKTQTRRLVKTTDGIPLHWYSDAAAKTYIFHADYCNVKKAPCEKGDILWVRETWTPYCMNIKTCPNGVLAHAKYCYKASVDDAWHGCVDDSLPESCRWRPSIHMPKEAARIFLRVKNVRVERLQDISVLDAINEGCCGTICDHSDANPELGCTDCYNTGWLERPETEFALLWDTTVKKDDLPVYGWEANPWVWVIEFERCEAPKEERHE